MQKKDKLNEETKQTELNEDMWKCAKCKATLVCKSVTFEYMDMTFSHEVLRCPVCGMVLITKQLADGKMSEVEQMMEDK